MKDEWNEDWKCRLCGVEITLDRMHNNDKLCVKCFREKETTYD